MNKDRATQKRVFRAFRRAYLTGRMAKYLQWLYVEYGERKARRDKESRNFCKFLKQAERAYRGYHKEFMVATESEKRDFETMANRLRALGRRDFTVASRVARA